jgi:hypothetical protein
MWKVFLLAVSLHGAQGQSMECSNNASTHSRKVSGPAGVSAVLRVDSADDHSKNSHDCMADYSLLISPSDGMDTGRFFASDGEWGRTLSVHLDGFSRDGKHIFGIISEGGKFSFAMVLDYDKTAHHAEVINVQKALTLLKSAKCGTAFAVAGTTTGAIVLEPNTPSNCRVDHRWLVDRTGKLETLAQDSAILSLYKAGAVK